MIQIIKQNYVNFRNKCFPSRWNFTLHEQILLKLHFLLTLLILSRKLCVILITDTNYIISSFLFVEASMKIHQVKDMVIIIIFKIHLNSPTTYAQKMLIALKVHVGVCMWECTCQNLVHNTSVSTKEGSISSVAFLVCCRGCFPLIK